MSTKGRRKSYLLRINEDLWIELSEWASQEFRSVNGQMELILRRAVDERKKRRKESTNESETVRPSK
jgi:hypothetical protein